MEPGEGHFEVALCGDKIYVRAVGLASMNNTPALQTFVDEMLEKGATHVIVDLEGCSGMDSTFMGAVAGMAFPLGKGPAPRVTVINASPNNMRLLEGLGLGEVVELCHEWVASPCVQTERVSGEAPAEERLELIRDAHQKLIELDPRNREKFGPFLRLLEEEIRQEAGEASAPPDDASF